VIGWVFIVLGIFSTLMASLQILRYVSWMCHREGGPELQPLQILLQIPLFDVLSLVTSVLLMVGASGLLARRRWGRAILTGALVGCTLFMTYTLPISFATLGNWTASTAEQAPGVRSDFFINLAFHLAIQFALVIFYVFVLFRLYRGPVALEFRRRPSSPEPPPLPTQPS